MDDSEPDERLNIQSEDSLEEQRFEADTVMFAALGDFAKNSLFSEEQRMHIDQWLGWAAANNSRLQRYVTT